MLSELNTLTTQQQNLAEGKRVYCCIYNATSD